MLPDRIVRRTVRSRYLVTTESDETFDGIVLDADARTIVLADAAQVGADGSRTKLTGQVLIPRQTVKYLQTVTV